MTFSIDVSRWAAKAMGNADIVVKKVAIDALTKVVKMSPVDTGHFKGNWLLSVGVPAFGVSDVTDKQGDATINKGKANLVGFKAGPSIYIVNNLPYANRLEYGYSKWAPQGMVRITVREFQSFVDKAVKGLA